MNNWWIVPMLHHSIRCSNQRELAGVWVWGPFPAGAAVIAANHQSWWDGYLLSDLADRCG